MPARVLFFLPRLATYKDRVALLREVAARVERLVLLVGSVDDDIEASALEVVPVGFRRGRRLANIRAAQRTGARVTRDERLLIHHDTFSTLLPPIPGVSGPRVAVRIESLFSLIGWRLRRVWRGVSLIQLLRHRENAAMYYNALAERLALAAADHVVLQAPGLVEHLRSYSRFPLDRIHVIPNNVDCRYWAPLRPRQGPTGSAVRILLAGNIDRHRGVFHLLDAAARLRAQGIRAELTLAGRWNPLDKEPARRMIVELGLTGQVQITPPVPRDDLLKAFQEHDVFVYETINDGSPRVVLEAASSGMPLVASDHPGIVAIDPEGEFVHFTRFGDVESIVGLMRAYLSGPEEWLQRAALGRSRVRERFRTDVVAKRYVDLYREVLTETSGGTTD